jgi:hypothetical protein
MAYFPRVAQSKTAVVRGLQYWWPLNGMGSKTGNTLELIQNKLTTASSSPTPGMGAGTYIDRRQNNCMVQNSGTAPCFVASAITFPSPAFTLMCRFYQLTPLAIGGYLRLIQSSGATPQLSLNIKGSSGFYVWYTGNKFEDPSSPTAPQLRWVHIAWTYDATTFQLVQDGVVVRTVAGTGNASPFTADCVICGNAYKGYMRDARIYNRALGIGEIRAILAEAYTPDASLTDFALLGPGGLPASGRKNPNMPMLGW